MITRFVVFLALLAHATAGLCADVTSTDMARAVKKDRLVHPYLYFSEQDKPAIRDRIENDPEFGDVMARLLAEANRLLYTPVETDAPPRQQNPRFETTYEYENYIQNNTTAAHTLAFVYQMTGDEKYAQKAFAFIDVVCDQPTWVHMAHEFPVIYDRVWPRGPKDDQVVFNYAQWSDHLVFDIAAVYDWLYPALEKRQRDRIRGALLENAILRVRGNYEYHWWAWAYRCNWCSVLNSSLGVASIALLTEDPQLVDVIAESYNRVSKVFDEIKSGGWQEGVSYMSYCVREAFRFADALKRVTGEEYDLYGHPNIPNAVKTILYCQFPPARSLHFGDAGSGKLGSYTLLNSIMIETGDKRAAWLRDNLGFTGPDDIIGLLKPRSGIKGEVSDNPSIHFPAVDWVIMRSDFTDPEKVSIATKAGMNDDPHHGHLDQGHFSLYWRGSEFVCDNGSAGYDRKYFDNERFEYPLASSNGHNVVLVNGEQQLIAKRKNEPWKEGIGGRVVEFRPALARDYVLMDLTDAYAKKDLKEWRRHIVLDKPVVTVVLDEVKAAKGAEVEARFHSAESIDLKDGNGYALLRGGGGMMAVIPALARGFTLRPGKHAILMAQRNARFRSVPYFGTVTESEGGVTVLGTVILPVADEDEAAAVAGSVALQDDGSGTLRLSFVKDGETFSYAFAESKDGLVLK